MRKFAMTFVVAVISTTFAPRARAAELTRDQIIAYCQDKYEATAAIAQCVTEIRLARAEEHAKQLVERLDVDEDRDHMILERLNELSESVDALADAGTSPSPEPEQTAAAAQSQPAHEGVAWQFMPDYNAVSIHNLGALPEYPDTLRVTSLRDESSRWRCGGLGAQYVVVTLDGYPITNVFGAGFQWIYWDGDNDGTPDPGVGLDTNGDGYGDGVVPALDLSTQDDIYMTWGMDAFGSPEDMRIVYVRTRRVSVAGVGYAQMGHPTTQAESSGGAIACRRSNMATPGGHQTIRLSSLTRVWH